LCNDNFIWFLVYKHCFPELSSFSTYLPKSELIITTPPDWRERVKSLVKSASNSKHPHIQSIIGSNFILNCLEKIYPHRKNWKRPLGIEFDEDSAIEYEFWIDSLVPDHAYFKENFDILDTKSLSFAILGLSIIHRFTDAPIQAGDLDVTHVKECTNGINSQLHRNPMQYSNPTHVTTILFIDLFSKNLINHCYFPYSSDPNHNLPAMKLRHLESKRNMFMLINEDDEMYWDRILFFKLDHKTPFLTPLIHLETTNPTQPKSKPPESIYDLHVNLNVFITAALPCPPAPNHEHLDSTSTTLILSLSFTYGSVQLYNHRTRHIEQIKHFGQLIDTAEEIQAVPDPPTRSIFSIDVVGSTAITGHLGVTRVWDFWSGALLFELKPPTPITGTLPWVVAASWASLRHIVTFEELPVADDDDEDEPDRRLSRMRFCIWDSLRGIKIRECGIDVADVVNADMGRVVSFEAWNQFLAFTVACDSLGVEFVIVFWDWEHDVVVAKISVNRMRPLSNCDDFEDDIDDMR
ncbi:hypothetical protein HK096_005074, partial [Nowakowskiella sp. JEL0078]